MTNKKGIAQPRLRGACGAAAFFFLQIVAWAGTDVPVNSGTTGVQNEVSVTLNPFVPGNVVMAYNDFPPAASVGLGISFSNDSGQSWTDRQIGTPPPNDPFSGTPLGLIFDPVTGAGNSGNVYAGYIATDGAQGGPSGLYVHRSGDGGNSWTAPIAVHNEAAQPGIPPGSYRFNDKPHLTVDRFNLNAMNNNSVYTAWIQDDGTSPPTDIRFSASLDTGTTWFPTPTTVNDNPGTDLANGPNAAVAPNGDVYVAWLDTDVTNNMPGPRAGTLYLDSSNDGGQTWGMDLPAHNVQTVPKHLSKLNNQLLQDDARARGYPSIAADPNDATGQTVYMVFAEDPDGGIAGDEADVFFTSTMDAGMNWSAPFRINDDNTINDQFAPWIAVKPDGTIDVVWYDKRNDPQDAQWDVYFARSTDQGASFFTNVRVTDQSFATTQASNGEPWLGEYLGIAVDNQFAYVGFTARGDANGDIFFDLVANQLQVPGVPEPSTLGFATFGAILWICLGAGNLRRRRGGSIQG